MNNEQSEDMIKTEGANSTFLRPRVNQGMLERLVAKWLNNKGKHNSARALRAKSRIAKRKAKRRA